MEKDAVIDTLKAFLAKEMLEGDAEGLEADTPLLDLGVINSMSIVLLSGFVERTWGLSVPQSQLTVKNLASLDRIAEMVLRLSGARA